MSQDLILLLPNASKALKIGKIFSATPNHGGRRRVPESLYLLDLTLDAACLMLFNVNQPELNVKLVLLTVLSVVNVVNVKH